MASSKACHTIPPVHFWSADGLNHRKRHSTLRGKGCGYGPAPQDAWSKGHAVDAWSAPYGKAGGGQQWAPAPQNAAPKNVAPPKDKLKIDGLPADSTEESVMALIGQYGAISRVKMMPSAGGPRTAIVTMGREDVARWLVDTLNRNIPQGIDTPVTQSCSPIFQGFVFRWGPRFPRPPQ
jgi:hypothetical protein